ncbi:unnamed protein product [Linum trigynum]|uniref:E3 ubiquitin-protein ligase RNF25 n=1 Tax=Linum trigynum TaxID=586398 RepID=A0AAV2ETB0_9ROSI
MADEEEILLEVEAVQAVYGDDCAVLDSFPPHLHLHMKPRTADISSQQFVEALISIRAGLQYPEEPPGISIIESKGLDERRQKELLTSIKDKAQELNSCLMLVALCEAAVEKLSIMNHPDGECPLCLYPLVLEKLEGETLSFMKLMSCFHCFHSECIIRWWAWLQKQKEHTSASSATTPQRIRPGNKMGTDDSMGKCPVCRKSFHAKDLEHVLDLVGTHSSRLDDDDVDDNDDDDLKVFGSQSEHTRREKFDAILKLQEECNGLIEPKKSIVVLPGMFLPRPLAALTPSSNEETIDQEPREAPPLSGNFSRNTSGRADGFAKRRNPNRRNRNPQSAQTQARHWVRKENGTSS